MEGVPKQQHQRDAQPGEAGIDMALHPVGRGEVPVVFERLLVGGFLTVEFRTLPHHLADAEHLGAVRILRGLAFRVMLAMHGDPFARHHTGGHPQPEAEEMADHGMQV